MFHRVVAKFIIILPCDALLCYHTILQCVIMRCFILLCNTIIMQGNSAVGGNMPEGGSMAEGLPDGMPTRLGLAEAALRRRR